MPRGKRNTDTAHTEVSNPNTDTKESNSMSTTETDFSNLFEEISVEDADKALASGADKGQFDELLEAFAASGLYAVAVPLTSGPLQGRDVTKARQSLTSARDRTKKVDGVATTVHPEWNVIKIRRTKGVDNKIFLINTSLKPAS
jgi:hypothetical protein